LPTSQYERIEHQEKVVEDILDNWLVLSQANKFHAIFATSSINEAIEYYRLIKRLKPDLKITALFDPNIDNEGTGAYKEDGLVEILEDYNLRYEQDYTLATHAKFKKDIASRLSHKEPYLWIEKNPEKQIDLLIVVNQMLTGFDSKWINTLYLDKLIEYENIIQAFSRTNRLFGPDKPFGTIRYYRFPHSMERNINAAVKLYSGDKPVDLFVDHLDENLGMLNSVFSDIEKLFANSGVQNFERLPNEISERGQFAKLFSLLNFILEAAKIQGFKWSESKYHFVKEEGNFEIDVALDENTYLILALRYKELYTGSSGGGSSSEVPYEIEGHLTEIDTDKIDADYMNTRFDKYLKVLQNKDIDPVELQNTLDELHKSFATLTQEEQRFGNIFLHDVQSGNLIIEKGKTFREYITLYQYNAKNDQIKKMATMFGLDEIKLRNMMESGLNETNINQYGRFDELKNTIDKAKAKTYFEELEKTTIPPFKVNIKAHNLIQKFIIEDGFEL
jgi:type I restriction enzyme R subunit